MIHFVIPTVQMHTFESLVRRTGESWSKRLRAITLDQLTRVDVLKRGTYVFSGLQVASDEGRQLASQAYETLEGAGGNRLLNHPTRFLRRRQLLERLHSKGINSFRVFKLEDLDRSDPTYPVFVRHEDGHQGALTDLLNDREEVERAVHELTRFGWDPGRLLVVEFCDTSRPNGMYEKYAALRVADRIFGVHFSYSGHWCVKRYPRLIQYGPSDKLTQKMIEVEYNYVKDNPHRVDLERVFEIAGVNFGRVDYGMRDGKPCIWEINTAPGFGRQPGSRSKEEATLHAMRRPRLEIQIERLKAALEEIDAEASDETFAFSPPIHLVEAVRRFEARSASDSRFRKRIKKWSRFIRKWSGMSQLKPLDAKLSGMVRRTLRHRLGER